MNRIVKIKLALHKFSISLVCLGIGLMLVDLAAAQTAQQRVDELNKQAGEVATSDDQQLWCTYQGKEGPGVGKHIVLISGDDEYRSEQTMPMLGKILAVRHGFKCTVLFAIDPSDGTIKPSHQTNIAGMEMIDSADLLILGLRFRSLPDEQMKHFVDYLDAGKPMIGTRTTTHAFNYQEDSESAYKHFAFNSKENWPGGFGQQVMGDTWVNHHGSHGNQSTRGVIAQGQEDHPILKGVTDVWGPSDVYGIKHLPESANVLLNGSVLSGMSSEDKPVEGKDAKKNDPMMPIAWTKGFKSKSGKENRIFCTTMGASTDFESEGLRRLVVNAAFWGLKMEDAIPESANVDYVDDYKPTAFGFGTFAKGLTPRDYDLKNKSEEDSSTEPPANKGLDVSVKTHGPNIRVGGRSKIHFSVKNSTQQSIENVNVRLKVPNSVSFETLFSDSNIGLVSRYEFATIRELRAGESIDWIADVQGLTPGQAVFEVQAKSDDTLGVSSANDAVVIEQ